MKTCLRKLCSALCILALLGSLLAVSAAEVSSINAHADIWNGNIFVNGHWTRFVNDKGRYAEPINYNGTIYIPHGVAGEWMGCEANWDRSAHTLTFTGGKDPFIRGITDTTRSTDDEIGIINSYRDNGVDMQVQPDLAVILDGVKQEFTAANGEPQYPFVFDGSVYLPVRGVGEMMGMYVIYIPGSPYDEPVHDQVITIFDPPTEAQITEMQDYVDKSTEIYWKAQKIAQDISEADDMKTDDAVQMLEQIDAYIKQIEALPLPSSPYLAGFQFGYSAVFARTQAVEPFIDYLKNGTYSFKEVKRRALTSILPTQLFYFYRHYQVAQIYLDALNAYKEAS